MENSQAETLPARASASPPKRFLNAGSGPYSARTLRPLFLPGEWEEIRLDINPKVNPDIVGSIIDLKSQIASASFEALWCSHMLEHLYAHEVPPALSEVHRILKQDGFALITSPDIETAASLIVEHGLHHVAYQSAAGPITPHDILFGHSASIARGNHFMSHKTGFTCARLGELLLDAGFTTVLVKREKFDLWALALREHADQEAVQRQLLLAGIDLSDRPERGLDENHVASDK
ncbi:MAG: class I SAM-dependent methyltransferase [Xanthobacteraceae bacterium]